MKLENLVQEKVPNKLKRLMVLITESQLKNVISKTIEKSKKEFDTQLTNNTKEFNTQHKIIFTWQGKMR